MDRAAARRPQRARLAAARTRSLSPHRRHPGPCLLDPDSRRRARGPHPRRRRTAGNRGERGGRAGRHHSACSSGGRARTRERRARSRRRGELGRASRRGRRSPRCASSPRCSISASLRPDPSPCGPDLLHPARRSGDLHVDHHSWRQCFPVRAQGARGPRREGHSLRAEAADAGRGAGLAGVSEDEPAGQDSVPPGRRLHAARLVVHHRLPRAHATRGPRSIPRTRSSSAARSGTRSTPTRSWSRPSGPCSSSASCAS